MSTKLPLDVNDNPIPALRLKDGAPHATHIAVLQVSAGGSVYVSEKV